jgi:MSHA biogenesis protein MshJ
VKQRFVKLTQSIDRLNLRERLFLFAAGLVIVGGLWEAVLAGPLDARERIAAEKVGALQERLQQLDATIGAAAIGMSEGMPNQLDRLQALRVRVAAGAEEMRIYTSDLVDPAQMRLVLEELLRRQGRLRLVSATNLPARPLVEREEDASAAAPRARSERAAGSEEPQLYRHSLVLTLKGSYLDCLAYLQVVERLPWHIYWARLEFSADDYPQNDIVIELRTLSLDEEWIGV